LLLFGILLNYLRKRAQGWHPIRWIGVFLLGLLAWCASLLLISLGRINYATILETCSFSAQC